MSTQTRPASALREALLEVVDRHLVAVAPRGLGRGPDEYDPAVRDHPMACALYARGLCLLYEATGAREQLAAADEVLERLLAMRAGGRSAWGLGFPWRGLDADHPYAVTTAICGLALLERTRVDGDATALEALRTTCRWLADELPWVPCGRTRAPAFGPGLPLAAHNVAALIGGLLRAAPDITGDRDLIPRATEALLAVRDGQSELGYWTYCREEDTADTDPTEMAPWRVLDQVHNAYILDGALTAHEAGAGNDPRFLGLRRLIVKGLRFHVAHLTSRGCGLEKLVVADGEDRTTAPMLRRRHVSRDYLSAGRWLVSAPREARLWGYGATIRTLAAAYAAGLIDLAPLEDMLGYVLATRATDPRGRFPYRWHDPRAFPRHEAHLFDGLCRALAVV